MTLQPLLPLAPNRVRRNYRGGRLLDLMEDKPLPGDGNRPEDWLCSTVRAVNPGMESILNEGLAGVVTFAGERRQLEDVLEQDPDYYLGSDHVKRFGPQPGFLAKLLDSAMRLHVQAHPTAEFARKHLGFPWGKFEAYVILGLRDEKNSSIRLGFQRPPSPQEWKRIILDQGIAAMDACFDPIPVRVGEVWVVPGGLPHAIGEGILMLEVMEPSDLVVRCEFERDGVIVPPEARFMQTPVDLALQIFDYTPLSVAQVETAYKIAPQPIGPGEELLIGPDQTDSFTIRSLIVDGQIQLPSPGFMQLGVVADGRGTLSVGDQTMSLKPGVRFVVAAAAPDLKLQSLPAQSLKVLFCAPGHGSSSA